MVESIPRSLANSGRRRRRAPRRGKASAGIGGFSQTPEALNPPLPGRKRVSFQTSRVGKGAVLAPQADPSAHKSGSGRYLATGAETHPTGLGSSSRERRRAGHLPLRAGSEGRARTTAPPQRLWGRLQHKEGRGEERRRGGGRSARVPESWAAPGLGGAAPRAREGRARAPQSHCPHTRVPRARALP